MAAGRPRQFDLDDVLCRAERLFWTNGFEGTTMAQLSEATGLQAGSIYAAFGSKAGLFEHVVDHYQQQVGRGYVEDALAAPSVHELIRRWLDGVVRFTTGADTPSGCLLVQSALVTGDGAERTRDLIRARHQASAAAVTERMHRAQESGDLPAHVDPALAVRFLTTVAEGLAVEAAMGTSRAELLALVDLVTQRLPWETEG
ncbi:TetR/AcrR family transcriptional regulator [Nocardia sp. NPDC050378]|uniref:TetR/AcrR family transcriptional regulator n=1 Tax=Nocardia sp. NPDC050378 TaxID=3155400 RepID=UPI0033F84381